MSLRAPRTSLRLLLAVAFLAAGAETAFGLGGCPHHDLLAAPAGGSGAAAGGYHGSAAGDDGRADHGRHGVPERDGHEGHGPCTCLGACQPISAATLGVAPGVEIGTAGRTLPTHEAAPRLVRPRGPQPYSLPWSNAPPAIG